jgi:hypothetical protein
MNVKLLSDLLALDPSTRTTVPLYAGDSSDVIASKYVCIIGMLSHVDCQRHVLDIYVFLFVQGSASDDRRSVYDKSEAGCLGVVQR